MAKKFDLSVTTGETVRPDHFEHPDHGYLSYDPNTLYINPHRSGQRPISKPIKMVGKFFGTKQPYVSTCSEPSDGNRGCSKWAACPMKNYRHVGPGAVIMKKIDARSFAHCYDFFETTRGGRPVSQIHYGMDGWKLDTEHTSIPVLGRTHAAKSGGLDSESSREKVISSKPKMWEMEIGDLLPPWWPLMKKKGLKLPLSAEHYPELVEDDENAEDAEGPSEPKRRGRRSRRSA